MAKKKMSPKKSTTKPAGLPQQARSKKKPTKKPEAKKPVATKKAMGAKKIAKKAITPTKTSSAETGKKPIAKLSPVKKEIVAAKAASRNPSGRQESSLYSVDQARPRGLGYRPGSSGVEGLSNVADADSESVEELTEEGQAFEAEVVSGVEDASDPDEAEVTTKEVPEDDVPPEYDGEQ